MGKQIYTATFQHKNGYIYWGSRDERVRAVYLEKVHNCKGQEIFAISRTKRTLIWDAVPLKPGDIVQFKAELVGSRLMSVSGLKVIGRV